GLARTSKSMDKIAQAFEHKGYLVVNVNYPSRTDTVEKLSAVAMQQALTACEQGSTRLQGKIHFVTHSMGGILLRYYLAEQSIENLGRAVLIAPPNQGSEVVDRLGNVPGFKRLNGPAGMQLGTDKNSIPSTLGPVDFPVGVIAGSRSINPILSLNLPKPNDGKVSVKSTKVEGMADFIQFPLNHTFIMRNEHVIKQSILFIQTGNFQHPLE
ncbi:MAG: triacylglycerol esterase/lipase EstA (alpha/beta hydrolase family), partial [Candidatus Azotimanducaceae bacterium]